MHIDVFPAEENRVTMGSRDAHYSNGKPARHHNGLFQSHRSKTPPRAPPMVPLASLLAYELKNEIVENPLLRCGLALQPRKGEDFALVKTDCQRIPGDGSSTFAVFGIFDGHNGSAAAIHTKENLLNDVMSALNPRLKRDDWLAALPRALVAGFVKTDKEFQAKEQTSGTTVTFVVIDGWTITVACVGDSRCVLDSQGVVTDLTVDHRLDCNEEERERVRAAGGEVGRLNIVGGAEIGPLRVWPGGLCLSRSIGDTDVGEFIVPVPHVKQIKLSSGGGRLIIASDGVWDALDSEKAAKCCRGLSQPEVAAKHIVKETLRTRGLRDDTTCLVVDLLPPSNFEPPSPVIKKKSTIYRMFHWKKSHSNPSVPSYNGVPVMEELFEEGSAMLSERLGYQASINGGNGMFLCAICQCDIEANDGISVHAGAFFSGKSRPLDGPFLCVSCKWKQDAMEGKQTTSRAQSSS